MAYELRITEHAEEQLDTFPYCRDVYLSKKGYHEAVVPQMDYMIVFGIEENIVNVVGIFHQLENYPQKL